MKKAEPGDYLLWEGELVKVIGSSDSDRVVYMEYIDKPKCQNCGEPYDEQFSAIESSPLFQRNAEPINTIKEQQ